MAANYYSLIFRAVSKLPSNTPKARRGIYERARKALAAQTDAKPEHNALERAIRAVEKSPHEIPGTRGPTWLLLLSIFFLGNLWLLDSTCMSVFWVVRPWNKKLMATVGANETDAKIKLDDSFKVDVAIGRSDERFFATNLNVRRLALSIGIAGAIITPLFTGSLGRFIRYGYSPHLARDIAIGSILPAFLILVVSPIARRYWRWLTS